MADMMVTTLDFGEQSVAAVPGIHGSWFMDQDVMYIRPKFILERSSKL